MGGAAPRYAIYYLPDEGSRLAEFGARWFGYDCHAGRACERDTHGLGDSAAEVVAAPARYGFHATLVAPFHLGPGVKLDDVVARMESVARSVGGPQRLQLSMGELSGFLALRPDDDMPLRRLALACVMGCDTLRAALTQKERERRLRAHLTTYQRILMETYGYPYVADEFRFHMTLTGNLGEKERKRVATALAGPLAPILADGLELSAISLLEQRDANSQFRFHSRVALSA